MKRPAIIITLLLLGLVHPAVAADLPTTREVLDRFVTAVGGRQALEALELRRARGTIVQDLTWTDPQHQETPFVAEADVSGRVLAPRELPFEHYSLYFDVQTGLLNHVGYHNDLKDWREVEGVLLPRRWVFGRKGGHTTYVFEDFASGPATRNH